MTKITGGNRSKAYKHKHTYNARARESNERKLNMLKNMEVRRFEKALSIQTDLMRKYVPPNTQKQIVDPLYDLKGAARPARAFYPQPDLDPEPQERDLIDEYRNSMWAHEEGQKLLKIMLKLSVALYNISGRRKEAERLLIRMREYDAEDHLRARDALLRLYLDTAQGERVREILTSFSADQSALFSYSRVLLEYISYNLLEEEESSSEAGERELLTAYSHNPYVLWLLAYPDAFSLSFSHISSLSTSLPQSESEREREGETEREREEEEEEREREEYAVGSLEEAFLFFELDAPLWRETEGVCDWCREVIIGRELVPPEGSPTPTQEGLSERDRELIRVFERGLECILETE